MQGPDLLGPLKHLLTATQSVRPLPAIMSDVLHIAFLARIFSMLRLASSCLNRRTESLQTCSCAADASCVNFSQDLQHSYDKLCQNRKLANNFTCQLFDRVVGCHRWAPESQTRVQDIQVH